MRSRLVVVASAVSLPLFVAVFALCLISAVHPMRWSQTLDYFTAGGGGAVFQRHRCIGLSDGIIYAQWANRGFLNPAQPITTVVRGYPVAYPLKTVTGFSLYSQAGRGWSYRQWAIPLWPFALLAAILPMRAYVQRRRALGVGLCRRCSYNLTGNVSGVCPECGTPVCSNSAGSGSA